MNNLNDFVSSLTNVITNNDKFTLFVHVTPDCDAIGSAFAMAKLIETNFNHKSVRIAGMDKLNKSYLPLFFQQNYLPVDDDFATDSIGITFDTPVKDRIFQKKYLSLCKKTFKIDHHIFVEQFCNEEFVNENSSSTCEIVGLIAMKNNWVLTNEIANSLYFGLLTDTIKFTTQNTNANTYLVLNFLQNSNKLNKNLVHDQLYLKTIKEFKLEQKLAKKIKYYNGFAMLVFGPKKTAKYGMNNLKNKLFIMSGITEIKIYCLIYYDPVTNVYKGSIRSRDFNVNAIAKKFNGGGHKLASGFKLDSKQEIKNLKQEIKRCLKLKDNYE